jgi:hypothetical protein
MKTNELRIGNLLDRNGKMEVYQIDGKSHSGRIRIYDHVNQTYLNHWFDLDSFNPIPLTEEWLMKHYELDTFGNIKINNGCCIPIPIKTISIWQDYLEDDLVIKLPDYVHQFQNLYFALTDSELPISQHK